MTTINKSLLKSISFLSRKRAEERSKQFIVLLVITAILLHYLKYKETIDALLN
jgi:hypothetical protein